MSDEADMPRVIYFDSNALLGAGWPRPSAQLLEVTENAVAMRCTLCVPLVVQHELEGHWVREIQKNWSSIRNGTTAVNRAAAGLFELPPPGALPSAGKMIEGLRENIAGLSTRFVSVPITTMKVADFIRLAIGRGVTFKDHGHGFQDAVILCSIVEHMRSNGYTDSILVSKDEAFKFDGVKSYLRESNVRLQIVDDLDGLSKRLESLLSTLVLAHIEREKTAILALATARSEEVQAFLNENLTINKEQLVALGTIRMIRSLRVTGFTNAFVSRSIGTEGETPGVETRPASVDAEVQLELEVTRYEAPTTTSLKIGAVPVEPELAFHNFLAPPVIAVEQKVVTVTIQAEVTQTASGFENLRLQSASLKLELGLFSALKISV